MYNKYSGCFYGRCLKAFFLFLCNFTSTTLNIKNFFGLVIKVCLFSCDLSLCVLRSYIYLLSHLLNLQGIAVHFINNIPNVFKEKKCIGLYTQKVEKYRSNKRQHRVITKKFHKNENAKCQFRDRKI